MGGKAILAATVVAASSAGAIIWVGQPDWLPANKWINPTQAETATLEKTASIEASPSVEPVVEAEHEEGYVPTEQKKLNELVANGAPGEAFTTAFEAGDELTEIAFTADQGVGASLGDGRRFARFPRADLIGETDWTNHKPIREGGPNATSCIACHNAPIANGAGDVALNAVIDPTHSGDPTKFLERNTLTLFALGVPQRLAEEMSTELYAQRDAAMQLACKDGKVRQNLTAKGVSFGSLTVERRNQTPCQVAMDWRELEGVDEDLVIKPFGWKGNKPTIRAFTRSAAHNELGLQAVELVGNKDGDYDGVINELTVGDMTALTIYMAGLERPVTKLELAELGLKPISADLKRDVSRGRELFDAVGCASCHTPQMQLQDVNFKEPSNTAGFYDKIFPSGDTPAEQGLDSAQAIAFNLTTDQPNNQIKMKDGKTFHLGALRKNKSGATVNWFTDFKRHDMGAELADPTSAQGIPRQLWLTRSLAGVGSTGPWLHDGRATTLDDAIRFHGGEGDESRQKYVALAEADRHAVVRFLENLVIFKQEEKEE